MCAKLIDANNALNTLKVEKYSLCARLFEVNYIVNSLKIENCLLFYRVHVLDDTKETSKFEHPVDAPASKLDCMLSFQKLYVDKCRLGFYPIASTSKSTSTNK